MSEEDNKFESKHNDNNISDKDEELLKNLNASINNKKLDDSLKQNQTNNEEDKDEEEINNKYIKKYKSKDDSRLFGITFQSSIESNIINFAVSSLNISKDNNITLLSFQQEEEINEEEETNINTINNEENNSIKFKSQVKCEFPVSSILFSPHEENKN